MLQTVISFFSHPFFVIVGGLTTVSAIAGAAYTLYLLIKGVFPVWVRLGLGLSKREIAVFAEGEYGNLRDILVDSGIFKAKNIKKIDKQLIKKAETISLFLVHWKCFESEIDSILAIKRYSDALIIYAPQHEGFIDKDILSKINAQPNSIIVNFRGRLLNDILISIITTSYSKKR
ncbi:MAG: hypothetical protein D3908_07215 [Candidatus Electrothrix sp. AUS4]|nr:hypothetical protein [Candidatus Electrothrix sp. AUS4]